MAQMGIGDYFEHFNLLPCLNTRKRRHIDPFHIALMLIRLAGELELIPTKFRWDTGSTLNWPLHFWSLAVWSGQILSKWMSVCPTWTSAAVLPPPECPNWSLKAPKWSTPQPGRQPALVSLWQEQEIYMKGQGIKSKEQGKQNPQGTKNNKERERITIKRLRTRTKK